MWRRSLAAAALVVLSAATAAAQTERKSLQIFNDVAKSVNRYSSFTIFDDVQAGVQDGVVTLTGKVTMPYKRSDIETRVSRVEGVRAVRNHIEVLPVSLFDEELRHRIARGIYGNPSFWNYAAMPNPPIHIVVERGRVTLTGVVNNNVEKMMAYSIATGSSAFSVTNELRTDAQVQAELEKIE